MTFLIKVEAHHKTGGTKDIKISEFGRTKKVHRKAPPKVNNEGEDIGNLA